MPSGYGDLGYGEGGWGGPNQVARAPSTASSKTASTPSS
jgi:hypothetical protein